LIGEIPPQSGRRLREAAAAAEAAARRVRAETNAGARLLRASRQTNEEIVRALSGGSNPGSSGYDNRANKVGVRADGGHLLTGTA
jgi:hypothetical protein